MALNKLQKLAGVSAVALTVAVAASDSWSAAYTAGSGTAFTVPVTATVDNSISVTNTTPLALGQIGVLGDGVDTATMAMTAAGVVTDDTAGPALMIHSSGTGIPGLVDVTGAFNNTNLSVDMANPVDLNCAACAAGTPNFVLDDVITNLATPGSLATATTAVGTTDGAGALPINYGMTISTEADTNVYEDGTYAGTFDFFFSY